MAQVTLLCGPAGAGKTTIARELEAAGAVVLSFDREAWARGVRDGRPSRELVEAVDADLQERMRTAVVAGERVVVDASMSVRAVRDEWRARCAALGAEHELVVVRAERATLHDRVEARTPGPDAVRLEHDALDAYLDGFEWPGDDEPHTLVET